MDATDGPAIDVNGHQDDDLVPAIDPSPGRAVSDSDGNAWTSGLGGFGIARGIASSNDMLSPSAIFAASASEAFRREATKRSRTVTGRLSDRSSSTTAEPTWPRPPMITNMRKPANCDAVVDANPHPRLCRRPLPAVSGTLHSRRPFGEPCKATQ